MSTTTNKQRIEMPQIYETAPLDTYTQQITQGVVFVGGALTLPGLFLGLSGLLQYGYGMYGVVMSAGMAAAVLMYVWLAWAGVPVRLEIHADALVIKRRWWRRIRVPLTDIQTVTRLVDFDIRRERWGFNRGVFGYQGPSSSQRYGRLFCMATDRERVVALVRPGQRMLLVSPAQPAGFIYALQDAMRPSHTTSDAGKE